jgi:hypothetical protein
MKNVASNLGIAKSSIKSVTKSASLPDGKVDGLKSNNGIENSVSGVAEEDQEQNTRSGAILGAMFEFGIEHAQEYAQRRDVEADLRWWSRMNQRTMIEKDDAGQKYAGAAAAAGGQGALGAIGGGLAGAFLQNKESQKSQEDQEGTQKKSQNGVHNLAQNEAKDGKKITENSDEQNFQGQEMLAHNETESWQDQGFETIDATDPEVMFG